MLIVANPADALRWWRLPADGVGLARIEFIIPRLCSLPGRMRYRLPLRHAGQLRPRQQQVAAAKADALVIANGFSCREQIAQGTSRRALHLAEVIQMALRQG